MNNEKRNNSDLKSCDLVCQSFIIYVKPDRSSYTCFKHKHSLMLVFMLDDIEINTTYARVSNSKSHNEPLVTGWKQTGCFILLFAALLWESNVEKNSKAAKSHIALFSNSKKRLDFSHKITSTEGNFLFKQTFPSSQRTLFPLCKARACGRQLCHAPLGELPCMLLLLLLLGNCPELQSITLTRKAEL